MSIKQFYWADDVLEHLVGQSVVEASMEDATLVLSNGVRITFNREEHDCCSSVSLRSLHTTDNIITAAELRDTEDETGGEGPYEAWLYVVTADGKAASIAEVDGDASNGYYLHGFGLGGTIAFPEDGAR